MKYFKLKFLLLFFALAAAIPPAWAATETVTFSEQGYTNGQYITSYSGSSFSLSFTDGGNTNAPRYFTDGTSIRLYAKNSMTVSSEQNITKIEITFGSGGNSNSISTNVPTYSSEGTWSGEAQSVKFTVGGSSGHRRIAAVTVTTEDIILPDYAATVTPVGTINFGKTAPNTSLTQNVTVKNTGINPITPTISGLGTPFSTSYTPTEIASGETATIPVAFTPTSTGDYNSTMTVGFGTADIDPVNISLTGSSALEITICEGTGYYNYTNYLPIYGLYYDCPQINGMIYPASLLEDIVGKRIKSITFYSKGINYSGGSYNVSVANTTVDKFTTAARLDDVTLTLVAAGYNAGTGVEGSNLTINFNQPFEYTGGNLLIDFEVTSAGSDATTSFYGDNSYDSGVSFYSAFGWSNPAQLTSYLPKLTIAYEDGGAVVEPTPELIVDPDELDLDEATTFTVLGENLKGDVTITVDNANFTVNPATITKAEAEEGATVTVAYNGTNADGEIATVTVASQGAESATVTVMGAAKPVTVEKPVFDPEDGTTFEENLTVTLTCATTGATIQYSYNNEYFTNYTEPIVIDETTTIYAKAVLGEVESEVVSATYTKEAAPGIITDFKETFTDCDGTGGNDGSWSGNIASSAFSDSKADNAGWALVSGNAANECIKIGTGSKQGSATTPNIAVTPGITYTLTFNAGAWEGDQTTLNISATGGNLSQSTVTLNSGSWNNYTLTFTATDEIATITFSGVQASKARFFLDEIVLSHEASAQPTQVVATPTFNPEQGEYTEAQNVTITCATEDAVIHFTVDGTDPTAESPVYTEAITVEETTTIKAIAMKEDMTNSEIATATYTINIPSGDGQIYVKVTDPSQFVAGKKYIVVNEANSIAMGAYSDDYCAAVNVTIVNGTINISNTAVVPLKLEEASTKSIYYNGNTKTVTTYSAQMQDGSDLYLGYGGSSTKLKTIARATDNYFWYFGPDLTSDKGNNLFLAEANTRSLAQGSSNSGTLRFGAYTDDNSVLYVEKSDEPVVPELNVALAPAEKTYTVGEEAKIMVNVENGNEDTMVSYKINDGEDQDYNAETGIVLPNDKAKGYTVSVYATDGEREATATGTYSFTAAPAFEITLTPNKEGNYTVGDNAVVTVAVDKYIGEDYLVTYTFGDSEEQIEYNAQTGIVLPNDKAGDVTVTVYVTDGYEHAGDEFVSATYHFDAAPDIVVTLNPAGGNYYLGEQVKVTVTAQNTIGDYEVTYQIGDGEELDYEDGITIPSDQEGTVNLTVTVVDGYHDGAATATGAYTFAPRPVVAMPTLSLVGGTYGEAQQLTITAEDGATILYSTDGSEPTTVYTDAIALGEGTTTVKAIATLDGYTNSPVATATYIIEIPAELPDVPVMKGYFQIKNNGNNKYANIAGRKTLNFTDEPADKAGTVIWLETNGKGQVQSLRSQAVDLQGYANRAMRYVPQMVNLVVNKINEMNGIEDATGAGSVLGEHGLGEIMDTFNDCFDYHLYVEQVDDSYRIYGKTPSMQHVVNFYREHTHQVETKLPKLEQFINDALTKLREKIGGQSIFTEFSLHQIWDKMGRTLTEPVDDESTMTFYREVLNNKYYVWDFAYQTALIYWNNVKGHPRYNELKAQLGEYADYIDEFVNQIHPDFKYYIIQRGDEPDYISQGNKEIINKDPRTLWTLEERTDFTVTLPENSASTCRRYDNATTLYTDFAYTLPDGVTAYKVIAVDENGNAQTAVLDGVIPAQTPVLLTGVEPGEKVLTLSKESGTAPTDNLLVGPDYLITLYQFKTQQLVDLYSLAKGIIGDALYEEYVEPYEYLQLLYAGTVNNKYFWNVNSYINSTDFEDPDCVVRSLATDENGKLAFREHWKTENNKAFLVSDEHRVITLNVINHDVNHDGRVDATDIIDLIDFMLGIDGPACPFCSDINENGKVDAQDLTDLIDYLLSDPNYHPVDPDEGD